MLPAVCTRILKHRLTDIRTLKQTQEAMEAEVEKLAEENHRLSKSIQDLGDSVTRLKDIESALETITKTQGQSVDAFSKQVEENKKILASMQNNLKANVLQNLFSIILRSDVDGDNIIDKEEVDTLVARLERISGMDFNEEKFRGAIEGKTIKAVVDVVKHLLKDDLPDEDKIFFVQQ